MNESECESVHGADHVRAKENRGRGNEEFDEGNTQVCKEKSSWNT